MTTFDAAFIAAHRKRNKERRENLTAINRACREAALEELSSSPYHDITISLATKVSKWTDESDVMLDEITRQQHQLAIAREALKKGKELACSIGVNHSSLSPLEIGSILRDAEKAIAALDTEEEQRP